MARAEIVITNGDNESAIYEQEVFENEDAIRDGYCRFKDILSERGDFLLGATVQRDFDNNLTAEIRVRIGPLPFWSKEYLAERGLRYAPTSTAHKNEGGIAS